MESHGKKLARKLKELNEGREPKVTKEDLIYSEYPLPEERAVLLLASALNDVGDKATSVPWKYQEEAMNFYNGKGLAATLDKLKELEAKAKGP